MNLLLELVLIALIIADTILTYKIISSGKGVEIGTFAKHYIKYPVWTIIITVVAIGLLLVWLNVVHMVWMLIPADLYMGFIVWKNWRILS